MLHGFGQSRLLDRPVFGDEAIARHGVHARRLEPGDEFVLEGAADARLAGDADDHDLVEPRRRILGAAPLTDDARRGTPGGDDQPGQGESEQSQSRGTHESSGFEYTGERPRGQDYVGRDRSDPALRAAARARIRKVSGARLAPDTRGTSSHAPAA